ncbi:hypothetical protein NEOLEDRAFT_529505 [Neolentinus lepideus HHB14362 ss-1]|uniref:Uncharacterized protein n=1 Tax=Neolentinus lepideus HHB14362 ss-1 TaxID=1314782 RepID=A0A165RET3_9AGAM|nr:hypothetical protein NEOLEDRAFT_529505 [Neolentinus lepideus HHB14362 ss-1]
MAGQKNNAAGDESRRIYPEPKQENGMPQHTRAWAEGWIWMPGSNCGEWAPEKGKVAVYESVEEHSSDNTNKCPLEIYWVFVMRSVLVIVIRCQSCGL